MGDTPDLHQCLTCSETIVGLEAYVAHRQAGCTADVKQPVTSLPVIDVKRIVFVGGGGGGGAGSVQGILTGAKCPTTGAGPKLATIRRRPAVSNAATKNASSPAPSSNKISVSATSASESSSNGSGPPSTDPPPRAVSPGPSPSASSGASPARSSAASPAASPAPSPDASPAPSPDASPAPSPAASPAAAPTPPTPAPRTARVIITRCELCDLDFKTRTAYKEHMDLTHRSGILPATSRAARKIDKRKAGLGVPNWVRSAQAAAAVAELEPSVQSDDEFGAVEELLIEEVRAEAKTKTKTTAATKRAWTAGDDDDGDAVDDGDDVVAIKTECPLCGPVREISLAAHVFSFDHAAAYRAFHTALDSYDQSGDDSTAARLRALTLDAMTCAAPFAPYRCHPCRFSCNRLADLRRHLGSPSHWLRRARKLCSVCGATISGAEHLDLPGHALGRIAIVSDAGFTCGVCEAPFAMQFAARQHVLRRHYVDARGVRTCGTCQAVLPTAGMAEHRARHDVPRRCDTCGKQLNTPRDVERHFRRSLCQYSGNIQQGRHKCRHCDFRNNLKVNVLVHESISHYPPHTGRKKTGSGGRAAAARKTAAGRPLRYFCPQCDLYFRKASLKPHMMKHTGEAPFHCVFCSRYFFVESERDQHELSSHQRRQQQEATPRPCELAAVGGIQRTTQPDVSCQLCGMKFKNGHAVRMHLTRDHRGERRPCPVEACDFTSSHASLLNRHLAVKHPDFRRFRCTQCSFACNTAVALDTHVNLHSGLKPYKCQHCEFATRFASHLKRHLRIHTGSRPYPCPFCEYKANNFENLRKHVITTRRHEGLSVYMCKFCPDSSGQMMFGTNYAREFKQHLRELHPEQFETGTALATYVAGLYNQEEDVIQTDTPIDHTYKVRSKFPKPRRPAPRRPRQSAAAAAASPSSSDAATTSSAADAGPGTFAVTVLPGKQFFRLRSNRGQQALAPVGKLPLPVLPAPAQPLPDAQHKESGGDPSAIDCVDVADTISLQMAPPVDATLGAVSAEDERFAPPPLGAEAALQSELVDDPAEAGPTRFSGNNCLIETTVPQVHIEDQSVHRTTLVKTESDSPDNETISMETNFPTEVTVVHSEETGECSSLLMTFFTPKGSRHVMVPRDVIIHKPDEPVFRRIKVVFAPDESEGADKVTIHKFY